MIGEIGEDLKEQLEGKPENWTTKVKDVSGEQVRKPGTHFHLSGFSCSSAVLRASEGPPPFVQVRVWGALGSWGMCGRKSSRVKDYQQGDCRGEGMEVPVKDSQGHFERVALIYSPDNFVFNPLASRVRNLRAISFANESMSEPPSRFAHGLSPLPVK